MQTETSLGGTGHRKTTDADHGVNSLLEEIELQERSNAVRVGETGYSGQVVSRPER